LISSKITGMKKWRRRVFLGHQFEDVIKEFGVRPSHEVEEDQGQVGESRCKAFSQGWKKLFLAWAWGSAAGGTITHHVRITTSQAGGRR
jgi:hypothetical protein